MTEIAAVPLWQLAKVVRSKNAGPFQFTVDLLFRQPGDYARVRDSGVLTESSIAAAYRLPIERVRGVFYWDAALAIKITIDRGVSAGAPLDNDCYGAQQHAPLLDFVLPAED
jgi:hypothetical protein